MGALKLISVLCLTGIVLPTASAVSIDIPDAGELIEGLGSDNREARISAALDAGKWFSILAGVRNANEYQALISALGEATGEKDRVVGLCASWSLATIRDERGKMIPELEKALRDEDEEMRRYAAEFLGDEGQEAIPILSAALDEKSPEVRGAIVRSLGKAGAESPEVTERILEVMTDRNPDVRRCAVIALGDCRIVTPQVIEALSSSLGNEDAWMRRCAADSLQKIALSERTGPGLLDAAEPALIQGLRDPESHVRKHSAIVLGYVDPKSEAAVEALTSALYDVSFRVQHAAIRSLRRFGPRAEPAVPALRDILSWEYDTEYEQRHTPREACATLVKIGTPSLPVLLHTARHGSEPSSWAAIRTLGTLVLGATDSVPLLEKALEDESVRNSTSKALEQAWSY